jgi:ATP-dependent helicase/nuclease subunit B
MAAAGCFEGLRAGDTSELTYWRLTGGPEPGEVRVAMREAHAIEAAAGHALDRLRDLADRFLFGTAPFTARPHPGRAPAASDYDHLSRLAEWSGAEDAEAGA